jgi:hypothetical protein
LKPILPPLPHRRIDWVYAALAIVIVVGVAYAISQRQPGSVRTALIQRDPTLSRSAIDLENTGSFREVDGSVPRRQRLWCGTVRGRESGQIAAVVYKGRRSSGAQVLELAAEWQAPLSERERWLMAECRRLT